MSNGKRADKKESSSSSHFAAGLCSGLLSAVLLQPADLLKTRIQQSPRIAPLPVPNTASAGAESLSIASKKLLEPTTATRVAVQPARTIRTCLAEILAQPDPVRELWRGTVASALRTGFGSALYFTTLNGMRREVARLSVLSDGDVVAGTGSLNRDGNGRGNFAQNSTTTSTTSALPRLSKTANLATGAAARAFAGLVLMPVTVLKVRMESNLHDVKLPAYPGNDGGPTKSSATQAQKKKMKKTRMTMSAACRAIARTDGLRGFFAGTGATAVRDAPYAGLYVLFYEWSKDVLGRAAAASPSSSSAVPTAASRATSASRETPTQAQSTPQASTTANSAPSTMSINFFSATLAAGLATAATNPFDAIKTRLQLQPRRYGNMLRAARIMILQEGGVRCLFDGLALRMGRKALSSAIAWTVYEEIIRRVEM